MYGGWKLQILWSFSGIWFFIQSPHLSREIWRFVETHPLFSEGWKDTNPAAVKAQDQSWPSDPQIPFEKLFEPHIPPVFLDRPKIDRSIFTKLLLKNGRPIFNARVPGFISYKSMQLSNDDQHSLTIIDDDDDDDDDDENKTRKYVMYSKSTINWIKFRNVINDKSVYIYIYTYRLPYNNTW